MRTVKICVINSYVVPRNKNKLKIDISISRYDIKYYMHANFGTRRMSNVGGINVVEI